MPGPLPSSRHDAAGWPGKRLGLPESGPRSIARPGRRVAALFIDWAIAYGVAFLFFRDDTGTVDEFAIIAIFAVAQILFITLTSGSIGHLMLGMRVVPMSGGWVGPWRPIVRTILLSIVVPALIWDADQRGMHDRFAGTVLVRT